MAGRQVRNKVVEAIQEQAIDESLSAYREWRQKVKNGILPIGIPEVGKTTLLSKYDVAEPNVFLDFNRTVKVNVDERRLREDLAKRVQGVEYVKTIDVPGEEPAQWAKAYFRNNPRVLVVMVDHRDPEIHVAAIEKFLSILRDGPTVWEKIAAIICRTNKNLARVLFVVNKIDKIPARDKEGLLSRYGGILASLHSELNVNIQTFQISLRDDDKMLDPFFTAAVDGVGRK